MLLIIVFHNVDSVIYQHNKLIGQNNTVVLFGEIKLLSNLVFKQNNLFFNNIKFCEFADKTQILKVTM